MLSFDPLRINIPFLIDVIFVSDPKQIEKIELSGDVDRLHVYPTKSLPWWVPLFFKATKFFDSSRNLWFCPFESRSNPEYLPRRKYLEDKVALGYTQEDVRNIANLLQTNASDDDLAHAMVQVVNKRFFGEEIPLDIAKRADATLQRISQAVIPWVYLRGVQAQKDVMNYAASHLPDDVHKLDIAHNVGEVMQTTLGALKTLKENLDQPIRDTFTEHAAEVMTAQVPRIAIKSSNFDGLLSSPSTAGKTVYIFKIGEAAAKTKDIRFTFGDIQPGRACVFMDFFLEFMTDLQQALQAAPAQ